MCYTGSVVRGKAIGQLGKLGPKAEDAVLPLAGLLKDTGYSIPEQAATALGAIGPAARAAVGALSLAKRKGMSDTLRRSAAEALMRMQEGQ